MQRFRRWWLVVLPLLAVYLAGTVYLPYYALGPGPARAVQPLIRFEDRQRFESEGSFVLTSVRYRRLTPIGLVQAWLDRDLAVVSRSALFAPGESDQEERRRSVSEMDQSKLDAAYVVLETLTGYPHEHGDGVLVHSVVRGCAADGRLFVGDVIDSIAGVPVDGLGDARRAIRAAGSGKPLRFDVTVDGQPESVTLVREPCGGNSRPLVGVFMIATFPFDVRIASGGIGGPSAGLAWALGLYDLLTPGDLTDGHTIAATGQLGIDGVVRPIGGIVEKVTAAAAAGANVFILPEDNLAQARQDGGDDVELVGVASFAEALAYLRGAS